MKIIYIAHPIGGDTKKNLKKVAKIARELNLAYPDILPMAGYFLDCYALDDNIPEERQRGIDNDTEFFNRSIMDEVWCYGDKISTGMWAEINKARAMGIKVRFMSKGTMRDWLVDEKMKKSLEDTESENMPF